MNCFWDFVTWFFLSSPSLPWQPGTRQQGWYIRGTLRKQFPNLTVQFILSLSTCERARAGEHAACIDIRFISPIYSPLFVGLSLSFFPVIHSLSLPSWDLIPIFIVPPQYVRWEGASLKVKLFLRSHTLTNWYEICYQHYSTGPKNNACSTWFEEYCNQVEVETVSSNRNKLHHTT